MYMYVTNNERWQNLFYTKSTSYTMYSNVIQKNVIELYILLQIMFPVHFSTSSNYNLQQGHN